MSSQQLGFDCRSESTAWMNIELFFAYLHRLDAYGRKTPARNFIVLLIIARLMVII